jgi:hypothetical protein
MTFSITLEELAAFENATDNWLQARLAFAMGLIKPSGDPYSDFRERDRHLGSGYGFEQSKKAIAEWEQKHPRPQLVPGRGPFPSIDPTTQPTNPTPIPS